MLTKLAEVRKALLALTGSAAVAVSAGLLSGTAEHWVTGVLAVATAFVTYYVPNADALSVPDAPHAGEVPTD